MKVSGIITTFNEEDHIEACIRSLDWCDEILVVDSFSTDKTLAISKGIEKVRILQREYYGSASQKNWAMDQASYDWMIILDADERCTEELRKEIEGILRNPAYNAYTILRKTYFLGRHIRFSGWQHDRVIRLLRKGAGRCPNIRAHGGIIPYGEAPMLDNPMEHYMVKDLGEYFSRLRTQSYWGAAQFYVDKKRIYFHNVWTHTLWRFIRTYIIQLGFLDGWRGIAFCYAQAFGTFKKYNICRKWKIQEHKGIKPELPKFDTEITNWFTGRYLK